MKGIEKIETSLGVPLVKNQNIWEISLSGLKVFTGLSVLSRIVSDQVVELISSSVGDIYSVYKINENVNPELVGMKINYIQVYARKGILDSMIFFKEEFRFQMRTVFGTFQREHWGEKLFPEFYGKKKNHPSLALVFPFHHTSENEEVDYRFILERSGSVREGFNLRLTVENHNRANIDLASIPHELVFDLGTRVYIEGSTKLAETLSDRIIESASRGELSYSEEGRFYRHLFGELSKTGLGEVEEIYFEWEKNFSRIITGIENKEIIKNLKKILLCLEDKNICNLFRNHETIKLYLDGFYVSAYLARAGRVLRFRINSPRISLSIDSYLERMPLLNNYSNELLQEDFSETSIFLIHHITSETLAFIASLRKLGVKSGFVLFVKYSGSVPGSYLDSILEIPEEEFSFASLVKRSEDGKEYFILSKNYSSLREFSDLEKELEERKLNFFDAMRLSAKIMFEKFSKKVGNSPLLLIEDGGYLAPVLNEDALEKNQIISNSLFATVEHTRNGYDRLLANQKKFGKLYYPCYTIALSKIKTKEESREVAHSILSAVESVLHSIGMVLSRRKPIVLGSLGNIGSFLVEYLLYGRLLNKNIIGVDIRYNDKIMNDQEFYSRTITEIPEEKLLECDLFLGVIGVSILKREEIDKIILYSKQNRIVFASGSTKNLEFLDLSNYIEELYRTESPTILGVPVEIKLERMIDPQSGADFGGKVSFYLPDNKKRVFYLLGDLTPINFLFYGVPSEMMDSVFLELLKVSYFLNSERKNNSLPKPGLYALDHELTQNGKINL